MMFALEGMTSLILNHENTAFQAAFGVTGDVMTASRPSPPTPLHRS